MTNSDINSSRSLKKEASLLTICKMVNLIITMMTSMLLSRFRTLDEYGTYSQITLVSNLIVTLFILGLPNAINYFYPRYDTNEERREFLTTFFSVNTILAIIAGAVMCILTPIIVIYFDNSNILDFFYLCALLPWTQITIQERSNLFVAANKTKILIKHTLLNSAALLAIIIFTKLLNQPFKFYMALYMVIEAVFALSVYYEARKIAGKLSFRINKVLLKSILVYSVPIGFSDMVSTITREVDKFMIGGFLDTESLAIYTNAAKEIALTVISTSFIAVLMPKMSRMIKEKRTYEAVVLWKDTISFTYIFMCFGVAALIVFAPQVMTILYSSKYLPGTGVFRIYVLILLWRTAYFGTLLSLHGKSKQILSCSITALLTNIILNILLYKLIGFDGPAWSTFISIGTVNLLQLYLSSKLTKIKMRDIFPWKDLSIISGINIICGVIIYFVLKIFQIGTSSTDCIISILIGIIWMFFYFGVVMRKKIRLNWKDKR